jgi:thioredoxin-dependent peroxiredoxin
MATTLLGENTVHTVGDLPAVGTKAPDFTLTSGDFTDVTKTAGKRTVLDIFPSIATGVCQTGVRRFNELAADLDNTEVICVSQDLPFAVANFCAAEDLDAVLVGSAFRSGFGTDYGVTMADGSWRGLLARAVVVLDEDGTVLHAELTSAIGVEPDYDAAIAALG